MASQHPILVVDDDTALRTALIEQLVQDGEFDPTEASTLAEAEAKLAKADARFDALLLDVSLPDGDGRDFCKKLRKQGMKTPIIMLTGSAEENDIVRGLDAGANDYISKPFRLNELLARLRAQLRSFENSEDAVFTIGPYTFRPAGEAAGGTGNTQPAHPPDRQGGRDPEVPVSPGRQAVARQVLLNEVWGYNAAVTTHTLETHVYRLRQRLRPTRRMRACW